jgi:hypothetical protein
MEEHHRPDLVGLFTVNLLLVYTQYYGWLLIATEWIFLSLWYHAKLRRFSFYTALVVLCFTPWCLLVAQALLDKHGLSSNLSWIRVPTVQDGVWFYTILNGPLRFNWSRATTVFGLVTFGTPVLAGLWRRGVRSSKDAGESALRSDAVLWFLALVAGVPTLIAFATSYVLPQSVWHPRYLIAVAMPYLLLVAVAVGDLRRQWLRITAMLIIAAWATLSGVAEIRTADRVSWAPVIQRMVDAAPSEGQINIYTYGSHDIQFYLDALGEERFNVVRMFDRTALPNTDYGWVSFRVHGDRYRMSIQDTTQSEVQALDRLIHDLTAKGYQTGNILEAGTPGYRIFLFAISR